MDTATSESPQSKVIGIPFTADNARLMALRSVEARKKRKEQPKPSVARSEASALEPADSFHNRMIACVREQMENTLEKMEDEDDPNKLDRLASAFDKLRDSERVLLGQPLPGSHRPSSPKRTKDQPQSYEPVE